jgi:hypothetical protein
MEELVRLRRKMAFFMVIFISAHIAIVAGMT